MTRNRHIAGRTTAVLCATIALTGLAAAPPERPGPLVYVANLHSDTVSVFDTRAGTVVDTVPVGDGPNGLAVGPDGCTVHVSNFESDTLSVIDTSTSATATVPVRDGPTGVAAHARSPAGV
ncbi:YncE family protein [Streptomyces sp. NPDC090036]|uniref:YncE family protein n=1 Tax=Streptomyces sp. NPDC090036 TaxID=3365926 RepID=UPI0037F2F39D